jgi:hypothetical protein
MFKRICPKCFLPAPTVPIHDDDVMNSLSHNGEIYICSQCGQMESMGGLFGEEAVYGMTIGIERAQAALYGLIRGRPATPVVKNPLLKLTKGQSLWYDFETKQVEIIDASKKKSN